jgi:predicted ATPase/DNA-binding SARP family transcriptional activator
LLGYLLLHCGERVPRKALAFALWPDETQTGARANLRRHLHLLQNTLPASRIPWIFTDASTLQWNPQSPYTCDAHTVPDMLPEGELLPDESGEWIEAERARLRAAVSKRLVDAALAARAASNAVQAVHFAQRLLSVDPFREDVVRLLMTLHVERADKSAALALYADLERRLHGELDATPSPETAALAAAIRAGDAPTLFQNNLPHYETSWIDATDKIAQVGEALRSARLVTLVGPGGIGKTRLAVEAATAAVAQYPGGIVFTDLASISSSDQALQSVAEALGAPAEIKNYASLARYLHGKTLLLVLDNCEHVLRGCARLAETILNGVPTVRMLATSREALAVNGESVWQVPALSPGEGLQLFASRLSAADRRFELRADNEALVERICRRLDGIPLALELAAGRAQSMDLGDLENNLDKRLELLGRAHVNTARQTLLGNLQWSYELLEPQEQHALVALSAFSGDFFLEAAAAMCPITVLGRLVEKSMVQFERRDNHGRYRLLETIRLFACERAAADEPAQLADRHASFYAGFLERGAENWGNRRQFEWLTKTGEEMPNIEDALRWTLAPLRDAQTGARIIAALWRRFEYTGDQEHGVRWLSAALPHAPTNALREELHLGLAHLYRTLLRHEESARHFQSCAALCRESGNDWTLSSALSGYSMCYQHPPHEMFAMQQEILDLATRCGNERQRALSLFSMAHLSSAMGEAATWALYHKQAMALIERIGDEYLLSSALYSAALERFTAHDFRGAKQQLERVLQIRRKYKHLRSIAEILHDLGDVALGMNDLLAARDYFSAGLQRSHEIGLEIGVTQCLEGLATVFFRQGDAEKSAVLFGGAQRLTRPDIGMFQNHVEAVSNETKERVARHLGDERMERSLRSGMLLTVAELVEIALTA